jgi:hypothetical protein
MKARNKGGMGAANVFLGHVQWEALENNNAIRGTSKVW